MARRPKIEPSFDPPRRRRGEPPASPPPPPKKKRKRSWPYVLLLAIFWAGIFGAVYVSHLISDLPDTAGLMVRTPSHDITILDDKGRFIARRGLKQGALVSVSELPAYVPNAFIAIEDRRFRSHFGIDPVGMLRAAITDVLAGHVEQGGSTLTQQLAKNLFLKPDRTFRRKIQEAVLALYLESRYSKDQILTLYLNRVYFGGGAYGIEAASERFFNRHASDLTVTEAAMLAGSVKAPTQYNPLSDPQASAARGRVVLNAMRDSGFITAATEHRAAAAKPDVAEQSGTPGSGYFVDWVVSNIQDYAGNTGQPIVVRTTLDLDTQEKAERTVDEELTLQGPKLHAHQAALVAMTPDGAVRAMVGGRDYADSPFNRATDALRQPGSAFKPFVYLTAFEQGRKPDETMLDGPVSIHGWKPSDYEGDYEGEITLTRAFAKSSNSVAAQLTEEIGPANVVRTAHRLGIASHLEAVPAIALGVSVVTPLEITAAYSTFANGGDGVIAHGITSIRTRGGKLLYRRKSSGIGRVMPEENAAEVTQLMVATVTSGTGRAARLDERPSAGKTGTTQDFHDAWFIGFTGDLVCGVWTGNDDSSPMHLATGGKLPAHIFKAFMEDAEKGLPVKPLAGLNRVASLDSGSPPAAASAAAGVDAATRSAKPDKGDAIDRLIDSIFGDGR